MPCLLTHLQGGWRCRRLLLRARVSAVATFHTKLQGSPFRHGQVWTLGRWKERAKHSCPCFLHNVPCVLAHVPCAWTTLITRSLITAPPKIIDISSGNIRELQSCPTLGDPMDCSPPGSSVHGILQATILTWVATSFSKNTDATL